MLDALNHLTMGSYLAFVLAVVIVRMLAHQQITRDTVVGAVCGYLLIAYVFGSVYAVLMTLTPDALSIGGSSSDGGHFDRIGRGAWGVMYFSFGSGSFWCHGVKPEMAQRKILAQNDAD